MTHYLLDARTATPHFPGIGRYVSNLARAIVPLLAQDERLTVLHDPAHPISLPMGASAHAVPVAASPFSLAQQWAVPRLMRRTRADVYHSAYMLMPYWPGVPTVLTVYDLIPLHYPEHSTTRARLLIRWMTRLALRVADHIITISDFTRRDFAAEFGVRSERVSTIPLAADPSFRPQAREALVAIRRKYGLPERFVLYLGSNKPHKNLTRLIEAWQTAAHEGKTEDSGLVIAGPWDARYPEARQVAEALAAEAATANHRPSSVVPSTPTVWLGSVPEADLPALYAAAEVFIFPSLYEGFGLPVLEAMACGTPVICSNTSSLPEVVGGAAVLVDPTDSPALSGALCRVLSDGSLRTELQRLGLAQAARFSWARTAATTLAIYRDTLR